MSVVLPDGTLVAVSKHAAQRWHARIAPDHPFEAAFQEAEHELSHAIPVPRFLFHQFFPASAAPPRRMSFYATAKVIFLVQGGGVLTLYPFSEEALICVIVWALMKQLPQEYPIWVEDMVS